MRRHISHITFYVSNLSVNVPYLKAEGAELPGHLHPSVTCVGTAPMLLISGGQEIYNTPPRGTSPISVPNKTVRLSPAYYAMTFVKIIFIESILMIKESVVKDCIE